MIRWECGSVLRVEARVGVRRGTRSPVLHQSSVRCSVS